MICLPISRSLSMKVLELLANHPKQLMAKLTKMRAPLGDTTARQRFLRTHGSERYQVSTSFFSLVLGKAVAFLNLPFELLLPPIDDVEIIIGEAAPLLLGLAFELLPVTFDSIPVHDAHSVSRVNGVLAGSKTMQFSNGKICRRQGTVYRRRQLLANAAMAASRVSA
jgi:hypothetical protein